MGAYPPGMSQADHDRVFEELGPSPAELAAEADAQNDFDADYPDEKIAPLWCYVCDRPADDCACEMDPAGPLPQSGCVLQPIRTHVTKLPEMP